MQIVKAFLKSLNSVLQMKTCFGQHLNNLRRRNIGHMILAHININSIHYKFDQLVYGVKGKFDVLMLTETKLDDSFSTM